MCERATFLESARFAAAFWPSIYQIARRSCRSFYSSVNLLVLVMPSSFLVSTITTLASVSVTTWLRSVCDEITNRENPAAVCTSPQCGGTNRLRATALPQLDVTLLQGLANSEISYTHSVSNLAKRILGTFAAKSEVCGHHSVFQLFRRCLRVFG